MSTAEPPPSEAHRRHAAAATSWSGSRASRARAGVALPAPLRGMLPMNELLRSSGQYGARLPVPENADVQTKLLGFIGRHP